MGQCECHPEKETPYICMKHQRYLCDECMKCVDPDIYCKFRSSCPIWFMDKRAKSFKEEKTADEVKEFMVNIAPNGVSVKAKKGETLLKAFEKADVYINASCNGKGACGKCRLVVTKGRVESKKTALLSDSEIDKGYVLACMSTITGDVDVKIPEEAIEKRLKAAGMGEHITTSLKGLVPATDPLLKEIPLELTPPSMTDTVSDLDRLNRGLKKAGFDIEKLNVGLAVVRQLAATIREENFKVTAHIVTRKCANEILAITPGAGPSKSLGVALDLGTTSIVVYLVDMNDQKVIAATSGHNRQSACGDDVINRIVCAEKDGVAKLSRMAKSTINSLIGEALESAGRKADDIKNIVISGNTTMTHLLLGLEPRYIRREPYIPVITELPVVSAKEAGLLANPIAAVFIMPGPASYVGGDIVSGLLYCGLHREEPVTLFIDVGTNGEIVLGNKDWLMAAACSAGPAFEGGGIRWGMRAESGAIEKVKINPLTLEPEIGAVDDEAPRGICGSGMIDLLCEMMMTDIIDARGKYALPDDHARMKLIRDEKTFVIVNADKTGIGEDIVFSESDIKSLVLSKGAVFAGFQVLLDHAGLDFSMVDRVFITGGFGQSLDIEKAVTIGLLPDINRDKFSYLGNSSVRGAYMALLSGDIRREALELSNKMTYIDFSSDGNYMEAFTSALFLPHTDLKAFPNIEKKLKDKGKLLGN